jgi:hypothetical protein
LTCGPEGAAWAAEAASTTSRARLIEVRIMVVLRVGRYRTGCREARRPKMREI